MRWLPGVAVNAHRVALVRIPQHVARLLAAHWLSPAGLGKGVICLMSACSAQQSLIALR